MRKRSTPVIKLAGVLLKTHLKIEKYNEIKLPQHFYIWGIPYSYYRLCGQLRYCGL
jgi:hypothetical protein